MTEENKQNKDINALNKKYFTIFEELKCARPALVNCDAAFLSIVQKITEQYEMEYKALHYTADVPKTSERIERLKALNEQIYFIGGRLAANREKLSEDIITFMQDAMLLEYKKQYSLLAGEYDVEMDRKIAEQQALHERLVPKRWKKRFLIFFKRKKQNYAATLVDIEANEKAGKDFAEKKKMIAALAAERFSTEMLAEDSREKIHAYIAERLAETQELVKIAKSADIEQTDENAKQDAEGAEGEPEQAAETLADKLMKEYRNKTKKKKTEKGAGNGNAGTGKCT